MGDGVILPGTGEKVSAEEIDTLNGGALDPVEKAQRVGIALLADGAATDVTPDDPLPVVAQGEVEVMFSSGGVPTNVSNTDPLPVVQTGTPALPTGAATSAKQDTIIGHVDGLEALLAAIQAAVETIDNIVAGSEAQVDVLTLPALVAGTANIGDVDVLTVPADPFGANADAAVAAGAAGSIQAKLRRLTQGVEDLKTSIVLAAGTAAIGKLSPNTGVDIGDVDVTSVVPGSGATNLGKAEDAGHNSGDVGVMALAVRTDTPATKGADNDYHPLQTNSVGGQWVSEVADPAGGCSIYKTLDLDESEEEIKATAGCVYGMIVMNRTTALRYLKLYNATAASVTVGTTTPVITIPIPEAAASGAAGFVFVFAPGILFSTAICAAVTTGFADNDTGAPGANDVVATFFYK